MKCCPRGSHAPLRIRAMSDEKGERVVFYSFSDIYSSWREGEPVTSWARGKRFSPFKYQPPFLDI